MSNIEIENLRENIDMITDVNIDTIKEKYNKLRFINDKIDEHLDQS